MAAAWCFDKYSRNNKQIKDKSYTPPSLCGYYVQKNVAVSLFRERDLGRFAIAAICNADALEFGGISFGALSARDALETCQCHEPTSINWLRRDWKEVKRALRRWGKCE